MICTTYFLTFFSELIPPTGYFLCFYTIAIIMLWLYRVFYIHLPRLFLDAFNSTQRYLSKIKNETEYY